MRITSIREWLKDLGLCQYATTFERNDIDERALPHINEADLKELGVSLGHRKLILVAISELHKKIEKDKSALNDSIKNNFRNENVDNVEQNKLQKEEFMIVSSIISILKYMESECPAATYLIARTLRNTLDLYAENEEPIETLIDLLDSEIEARPLGTSSEDGGVSTLALCWFRRMLHLKRRDQIASNDHAEAIGYVANLANKYRDSSFDDFKPPRNHEVMKSLSKSDHNSLGEILAELEGDFADQRRIPGVNLDEITREYHLVRWNMMALFDLRNEVDQGMVQKLTAELGAVISQEISCEQC